MNPWIILIVLILVIILLCYLFLNSQNAHYYIGKWYNSHLTRVDISQFQQTPEFKTLDSYVEANLPAIQSAIRESVQQTSSFNMNDFDQVHQTLMEGSAGWKTIWLRYLKQDTTHLTNPVLKQLFAKFNHQILNASISILEPGAEIPLHSGQTKAVVKYHIPVTIPPGDVGIEVSGQTFHWHNSHRLIFDDTLPHRVWNRTSERRVILLLDVYRPLSMTQSLMGKILLQLARFSRDYQTTYNRIAS